MKRERKSSAAPLPGELKEKIGRLVKASTIAKAARHLDIDQATLYRILGGGPVMKGTRALIEARLQEARS